MVSVSPSSFEGLQRLYQSVWVWLDVKDLLEACSVTAIVKGGLNLRLAEAFHERPRHEIYHIVQPKHASSSGGTTR